MKNVLFLTYYFPPSGGPGVQRSLKFVKYLPEFGWMPTVVTVRPDQASFPNIDPNLGSEIPESVRVERTSAWDPYALYARMLQREKQDIISVGFLGEADMNTRQRLARWVRANVFLPDARVGWVPFAAARGHRLLREIEYDAVLTTGPPHSTHLAGLTLKLIHQIPWVTDLRDPWTEIDYVAELPMTKAARAVDRWVERVVLSSADAGVVVSESMGRSLLERNDIALKVIENGFDPADFDAPASTSDRDQFVIGHIGNLNKARNPAVLWRALADLHPSGSMPKLRIQLTGNVEPEVLASAARYGCEHLVEVLPYVRHDEAVRRMQAATLLLLCINRVEGAEGITTGKLYEYLASGRPILGVGPPAGDAARVLGETDAGRMFAFDDVNGMRAYLRASYKAWDSGRTLQGAAPARSARYSRREQSRALAEVLNSVLRS